MSAKRDCPALNRSITSAECGAQRGTQINCPADCSYYPFGTRGYDLWIKIDTSISPKLSAHALSKLPEETLTDLLKRGVSRNEEDRNTIAWAFQNAVNYAMTVATDASGCNIGEAWAAAGYPGLNNDERGFASRLRNAFVTVFEVQRIRDNQTFECIDVFQPERGPFLVMDRAMTKGLNRFDRVLTWLMPMDGFFRPILTGNGITSELWTDWHHAIKAKLEEARTEHPELTLRDFLTRDLLSAAFLIEDLGTSWRDRILSNIDLHHCVATFLLTEAPDRVLAVLNSKPDFEMGDAVADDEFDKPLAHLHWLRRAEAKDIEDQAPELLQHDQDSDAVGVLGDLRVYPDRVVLSTMSKQKYAFAKDLLLKYCDGLVRFDSETITNLADKFRTPLAADESPASQVPAHEPVPPEIARRTKQETYEKRYSQFLDMPVPLLGDLTPRQAAQQPAKRPELIDLMKIHLNGLDAARRKENLEIDIDWLLDELGLQELK